LGGLTDAMEKWTRENEASRAVAAALALLDQGVDLGGKKYRHRHELHDT
jgi:hypothetical protein